MNQILLRTLKWGGVLLMLLSFGLSFVRAFIARDYPISGEIGCDPSITLCYMRPGEGEEDASYFNRVTRIASDTAACGIFSPDCLRDFSCDDQRCFVEECQESLLNEDESCMDPDTYLTLTDTEIEASGDAFSGNSPDSE